MNDTVSYLDYNATSPIRPGAAAAMAEALARGGNPSSAHRAGRLARAAVERARAQVAALAGAEAGAVIFTSGGTEANNLALRGAPAAGLVVAAIEHDSVLAAAAARGLPLSKVPARADGTVDLAALERALAEAPAPALVSVMLANNETGAIQPLADVVRLARKRGALVHTDAVQAAGRIAVAFADLGVDLMTLSAHKLGGPAGAGALLARDGVALRPLLVGGGQERGLRAGTENVAGIVGFGVAAELAAADLPQMGEVARLRDELERRVGAAVPEAVVHGAAAPRLPNTSCIGGTGVAAETQVMALDLAGVAVSAGAACTSGKLRPSHVLEAMGLGADAARTAIRVSLGRGTRAEDIDRFLAAWTALVARARRRAAEPAA